MKQSSHIYILAIFIFAAGTWLIIETGTVLLRAPEDLAGEWELTPEQPITAEPPHAMKVEQSGRFFKITLSGNKIVHLKMIEETVLDQRFGDHKRITLSGDHIRATFEGVSKADLWRLTLSGDTQGQWIAHMIERTYPKPTPSVRAVNMDASHAR